MGNENSIEWIAFAGRRRIAQGSPREVLTRLKALHEQRPQASLLLFDAASSQPVEIDLRGSMASVLRQAPAAAALPLQDEAVAASAGPGRPRLGVVAREVTLLPRHWDWLATQRGGASVTLRSVVEQAMRASAVADRRRVARESVYRFMHAMAGDEPGFEEASRALFAGDSQKLQQAVAAWPRDIRSHVLALAAREQAAAT
jgi:hypothetical protein